jgi:superfamily II DNA or RNA helicase
MLLDLYRNELVFSQIQNSGNFAQALERGKKLKFRKYADKFYISLTHFDTARQVLKEFSGQLSFTPNYERFARRFAVNPNPIHIDWYPCECEISGKGMPWDIIIPTTSFFNKAALNSKAYEKGQWDGTKQLFNTIDGRFPSGLLERVVKALRERNIPYTVKRRFDYPKPTFILHPVFEFTPTEDQINAVEALDKFNHGLAKLPTGFGKTSFVAASLIAKKGVKSMFLANQRVLINDAKNDFKQVFRNDNVKIGTIGDGEFDPGDITVASIQGVVAALTPPSVQEKQQVANDLALAKIHLSNAQTEEDREHWTKEIKRLTNKIEKLKFRAERSVLIKEYLQQVELFIVDESQVLGTDMWDKFLRACPAPYRYTLTATDTRTDGGRILIIAATGERRYESSAAEQIAKGRLSEFRGYFKKFDHKVDKDISKELTMEYHQAYRIFIVNNRIRNEHLCDKLIEWAKEGNSVLALVSWQEHGELVQQILLDKGMPDWTFEYIDGKTPKKKRNDDIERFRNGEFPILIGTSIFDVGFNAKNASKIVRFNAGGSEVREPQRAGRTVRKREDGSWGESYDIFDVNVPFFETQVMKRVKFLKAEFGDERIKVLPGVIEGELDIVSLRELMNEIPDETDRTKGEAIIDELVRRKELGSDDIPEMQGLDEIENNRDLKSMLDQLRFNL